MSLDLDVTCDGCQQAIDLGAEVYCEGCWDDTCATLPKVEQALRELAATLQPDAAARVQHLADRIYDMNEKGAPL